MRFYVRAVISVLHLAIPSDAKPHARYRSADRVLLQTRSTAHRVCRSRGFQRSATPRQRPTDNAHPSGERPSSERDASALLLPEDPGLRLDQEHAMTRLAGYRLLAHLGDDNRALALSDVALHDKAVVGFIPPMLRALAIAERDLAFVRGFGWMH